MAKRKQHTAAFKARGALAALKGDKTVNEVAAQFGDHPTLIHDWEKRLLAGSGAVFAGAANAAPAAEAPDDGPGPGPPGVPVPPAGRGRRAAGARVVGGHHLPALALGVHVPGGDDRLVQPAGGRLAAVEHARRGVLPRDAGGGPGDR